MIAGKLTAVCAISSMALMMIGRLLASGAHLNSLFRGVGRDTDADQAAIENGYDWGSEFMPTYGTSKLGAGHYAPQKPDWCLRIEDDPNHKKGK
jgi:hypothetical protein